MNISKISEIINGTLTGKGEANINWLLTDSRTLSFPEETLFFAIKTARNDGHKYIEELYNKGVRNFVVNVERERALSLKNANFIIVENPLTALQNLAAYHRQQFDIPIIGITGSNGKTIVKEWLYQLLHKDYNITRSPRSYNSQIGVPLSVWQLKNVETGRAPSLLGIFEAGISMPGEMEKLEPIICPTIGIITNIGEAHQENFTSLKEKCLEKLKLFTHSDVLIYNADNKLIDICVEQSGLSKKKFTWGKSDKNDVIINNLELIVNNYTEITYSCKKLNIQNSKFKIPFADAASIENALHCLATVLVLFNKKQSCCTGDSPLKNSFPFSYPCGGSPEGKRSLELEGAMQQLQPVAMRLEVKQGINNSLIINDSYNSDLNSLSIALDFMQQQTPDKNIKKTLILSDILQSGMSSGELYKTVAELVKAKGIQYFIGIGKIINNSKLIINNYLENDCQTAFFETTDEFLATLTSPLWEGLGEACILLKGSRYFQFERISEKLELIAHQTVLEVNLNALVQNFNYLRSYLKPETKTICMVKAYAYGSGSAEVSRTLQHNHCDYLAVAVADEGAELRKEGIHIPIIVMNPEHHSFNLIFEYNLEPEIYSFKLLQDFLKAAEKNGVIDYPVHIKIDTGMHRLGFFPEEIDKLINILKNQNSLKIRSVFSHLAGADEAQFDDFTRQQAAVFEEVSNKITSAFNHKILLHILNSAGTERFPEYQFDMVRLGIGLYIAPINPYKREKLNPSFGMVGEEVCSLKTTILQIKDITAGETVGYSRKGKIHKNSRIAVLPIGYADGYNRRLGNGNGKVFINGKLAPTIGNICMDLTMIDITGIDAKEGDIVEIFGKNISILEVSECLGTIPYEILTNISRRVKRIYFQE
jgi:alanine racemase